MFLNNHQISEESQKEFLPMKSLVHKTQVLWSSGGLDQNLLSLGIALLSARLTMFRGQGL